MYYNYLLRLLFFFVFFTSLGVAATFGVPILAAVSLTFLWFIQALDESVFLIKSLLDIVVLLCFTDSKSFVFLSLASHYSIEG